MSVRSVKLHDREAPKEEAAAEKRYKALLAEASEVLQKQLDVLNAHNQNTDIAAALTGLKEKIDNVEQSREV